MNSGDEKCLVVWEPVVTRLRGGSGETVLDEEAELFGLTKYITPEGGAA